MKLQNLKAKDLSKQMDIEAASSPDRGYLTLARTCVKPGYSFVISC